MTYIIDTPPNFCAHCGKGLNWNNSFARNDFYAHAAHSCDCGAHYQYVNTTTIIRVAQEAGGDMVQL